MNQPHPSQRARRRGNWIVWAGIIGLVVLGFVIVRGAIVGGEDTDQPSLTVSAAANVQSAFEEIGTRFTAETGIPVVFSFGSSGQLTQQIEAGAPADVFASADVGFVDDLGAEGLILPDTRMIYARGRLVLWTQEGSDLSVTDLQDLTADEVQRIAIANPDHAPYGRAAREAMQAAGVWDEVQPKMVLGESVRDAYQYVATGNVDVALIPYSLVIDDSRSLTLVPEELHEPLNQALAVVSATEHEAEAREFVEFVTGPQGREVLESFGYALPESE